MPRCEDCGRLAAHTRIECGHCGGHLVDGDGGGPEAGDEAEDRAGKLSRRAMLGYGVGSTLVTLGAFAAGWRTFLYEHTTPAEDVVREYVDALDRAHFVTAGELFHENAPDPPPTAAENPDLESVDLTVEETEVLDRAEDVSIAGVEELALVRTRITIESPFGGEQTVEPRITAARNEDGEWRIWRDRTTDNG
ncbi:MAG: hypothetical protein V5A55_06190 [Halovenus sp.]